MILSAFPPEFDLMTAGEREELTELISGNQAARVAFNNAPDSKTRHFCNARRLRIEARIDQLREQARARQPRIRKFKDLALPEWLA